VKNTSVFENKITWKDFACTKVWKKSLKKHSKKKELSASTWDLVKSYFPQFLKLCNKTPDELIEESLVDPEIGEERLDEYFEVLKNRIGFNSARNICYGTIQGFYSHNRVITKEWTSPEPHPAQVKSVDDNFPLWKFNEDSEEFELDRKVLQDFFSRLNPTCRAIAFALIGTGQDIGIILDRDVGFVRNQDYRHKRLSLNDNRSKTSEIIDGFYSVEATDAARSIVSSRPDADDADPLYATSVSARKKEFYNLHGRSFRNDGLDVLPPARKISKTVVEAEFRKKQRDMGIKLIKGQQGPLRPKRIGRKIYRTAAELAGIGDDRARKMLGQGAGNISSGVYLETGREIQERQFMKLEKLIWVFKEPELSKKEKETTKELRKQLERSMQDKNSFEDKMVQKFEDMEKKKDAEFVQFKEDLLKQFRLQMDSGAYVEKK